MATFLQGQPVTASGPALPDGPLMSITDWANLAQAPLRVAPPAPAALPAGAGDWWNLPAKIAAGRQIAEEEKAKFAGHWNDAGDAMRHAEWAQRTAQAAGPMFTSLAGFAHELENTLPTGWAPDAHSQPASERNMDLHNNAVGIRSAADGRPIDPGKLQLAPVVPVAQPPGGPYPPY